MGDFKIIERFSKVFNRVVYTVIDRDNEPIGAPDISMAEAMYLIQSLLDFEEEESFYA